jgi:FAD:protein FMN transferase
MLRRILNSMSPRKELASRSFRSMGGLATVTMGASGAHHLDALTTEVRTLFARLESELSKHRPESFVSRLSQNAGAAPIPVSADAYRVLSLSRHFDDLSGGATDVTVAPLVSLWGFGRTLGPGEIPSDQAIQELLALVDHRRMVLKDGTAFLPVKGMAVDLGGIAKGYAVDRAFDLCRAAGAEDFMVDLSGNLRVSGHPQGEDRWQIGVRDPFDRTGIIGRVDLPGGMAVATSGSYERFVMVGSRRFSHVIDPRTGYPVEGTSSVTVLAPDATSADGLSTAFFVEGLNGVEQMLRRSAPAEVLIVPDKYPPEIWVSPRFAQAFTPMPQYAEAVRLLQP